MSLIDNDDDWNDFQRECMRFTDVDFEANQVILVPYFVGASCGLRLQDSLLYQAEGALLLDVAIENDSHECDVTCQVPAGDYFAFRIESREKVRACRRIVGGCSE